MDTFVGLPAPRTAFALRRARAEAELLTRRLRCDGCGDERECARVEPLAFEARWYCLDSCWSYQLGILHGQRAAAQRLRALVDDFALTFR
jgi:hypothetical protein